MSHPEIIHRLRSAHLGNERTLWVRAPRDTASPCALTIFLDAEFYRDRIGVVGILDELAASDTIAKSWFVFVAMESVGARWIECPCHPPFVHFVNDELLPRLEHLHPAIAAATTRVLVGLSYTGLAAAFVAINAAGRFDKVISQSGSFWWDDCWLVEHIRGRNDLPRIEWYLEVGVRENAENVRHKEDVLQVVSQLAANRRMRDALRERSCAVNYVEFDGGHDFAAWKATLPDALRWALPLPGHRDS